MIKILFSTNDKIGSKLIRAGTWSKYSHCDILTEHGSVVGAVPFKGVIEYDPAERTTGKHEIKVVEGVSYHEVLSNVYSQMGKSYDWLGVIGVPFHRDWQRDDKWFCSELIAWALEKSGKPVILKRTNRVTPQDLLESPLVK